MEKISASEAARLLGVSIYNLATLEKQGLIHASHNSEGLSFYSADEIANIKPRRPLTLSEEAEQVGIGIQRDMAFSLSRTKKALIFGGGILSGYLILVAIFAILFIAKPLQTARWLGIAKNPSIPGTLALAPVVSKDGRVLAAETGPADEKSPIQTVLQPVGRASLAVVKTVSPGSYNEVSKVAILDPNDVLALNTEGSMTPEIPVNIPESSLLQVGTTDLISNLNSQYVQGRVPGSNPGDLQIVGDDGITGAPIPGGSLAPGDLSGLTNTNFSGSAGITNNNIDTPDITINTNGPLEGGGLVALGGSLTLDCPDCITSDTDFTPSSTDTLTNKTIDADDNTIRDLNSSNLEGDDYSDVINTGTYDINITGNAGSATNFSGLLAGDVTGPQNATVVHGINGTPFGLTTPTAGNLLIGDGTSWVTRALSGDGTLSSTGVFTLENTGTPGTYGSGNTIPVFTTDPQGRVSSVTDTAISGLSVSNFFSTDISQWTNDLDFITENSVNTLTNKTINGATNNITNISNSSLLHSSITVQGNIGSGTVPLGGTLKVLGAGINTASYVTGAVTITGTEVDTLAAVTGRGSTTATPLTLNGGVTTTTTTPLTIDTGTTGPISIGTGANAKAITIGNTTAATGLDLRSGTGNIDFTVGPTSSSGRVQIGNSGTATPDLLVLDNGTADPAGVNGGMYYNTTTNKFRCFQAGAWTNCISTGGDLQNAASYDTSEALLNIGAAETIVTSVTVTPATSTGDVYIRAKAEILSSNAADQTLTIKIEDNNNCTGTTIATNNITITSAAGTVIGDFEISGVEVDAGTSPQSYSFCAATPTGDTDIRLYQMFATVIDNGADLAEIYTTNDETIGPGDVVSLDSSLKTGMMKSVEGYDQNVLGIVSTSPGTVIGSVDKEGVKAMPVALSGRVPVKVSTQNGPIKAGDYLTTSSIPGVAMKSTKTGAIIGTAMASYDKTGEVGQVLTFVKNGSAAGKGLETESFSSEDSSGIVPIAATPETPKEEATVPTVTPEDAKTNTLSYITDAITGLLKNTVQFFNSVIFNDDVTFLGRPTFNNDTAGHASIKAGENVVEVKFEKEYSQKPVITASINLGDDAPTDKIPAYAIYDLSTKGFKIKLSETTTTDLNFSWVALIVQADKDK